MSVTLTYDDVNARVAITADGLAGATFATVERSVDQILWTTVRGGAAAQITFPTTISDAFSRTVSNGWGAADTGQAWTNVGGAAGDYSVAGGVGKHSNAAVSTPHFTVIGSSADVSLYYEITVPIALATGGLIDIGDAVFRFTDVNNFYQCHVVAQTTGQISIGIGKLVGGSFTTLAATVDIGAYTAGTVVKVRASIIGNLIQAKAWLSTASEPSAPTVSATDGSFNAALPFGVKTNVSGTNTNPLPVAISFDNLAAGTPTVVLYDYEFAPGVPNFYRVRGKVSGITFIGGGGGAGANNASVTVGVPVGTKVGDLMLAFCAIRNQAATVTTPAGWTALAVLNNVKLIGRRMQAGDTGVTVSFAGGSLGDACTVKIATFRGPDAVQANSNAQINTTVQNIQYPALTNNVAGRLLIAYGWKQTASVWTSVATLTSLAFTELDDAASSDGNTQGLVWDYLLSTAAATIPSDTFVVTGSAAANSYGLNIVFDPLAFLNEQIANVTPTLAYVWLKSTARSFLNQRVIVTDYDEPGRDSRGGMAFVDGRTLPIAQVELMAGRKLNLGIRAADLATMQRYDFLIASGDVLFLQPPLGSALPSGYFRVDSGFTVTRPWARSTARYFTLPLVEVAAPGPDIVTAQATYDSIVAQYGTYDALLAAIGTSWDQFYALVGSPSEVIVP